MRSTTLLSIAVLVSIPGAGWPQGTPLGPEFRVNTFTTGLQYAPSIAAGAAGDFVVVWSDAAQDGSLFGIEGQRYAGSGEPLGPQFHVNTYTTGYQRAPSVATDAAGNFVVVWTSPADGSQYGVFGQRYAASGTPLGAEFRVNTYTTSVQFLASVAADPAGNFVVVWLSAQGGTPVGVFGQRFASPGVPLGPEFRVDTNTADAKFDPKVAVDGSGDFVVVWMSHQDGSFYGISARRFAASGSPLGPDFQVNSYTTGGQLYPSIGTGASGDFVVVWQSYLQDGAGNGIFGQRYASSGSPLGPEFRVNTSTSNEERAPSVAVDASGDFVVTWERISDGSGFGVFGQRYAGSGTPLGPEFRVNTYTTANQMGSRAAAVGGDFVVAWTSDGQDGANGGIFGQRYSQIVPVELMRFTVE